MYVAVPIVENNPSCISIASLLKLNLQSDHCIHNPGGLFFWLTACYTGTSYVTASINKRAVGRKIISYYYMYCSCGGNYLLNAGPIHDGRIAPIMEERFRQLGETHYSSICNCVALYDGLMSIQQASELH